MIPSNGLCVGLDIDLSKIPLHLRGRADAIVAFNEAIIGATRHVAACFKINLAFYEQYGKAGIDAMYATRELCGSSYVIADAKRGDIGNTSAAYAKAVFDDLKADAVTVSPYMGSDSVGPFLEVQNKMVYVLALTSNAGSHDFQRCMVDGEPLYERVMRTALAWERRADIGFVVGATHAAELATLRTSFPNVPFLVPGVGSQGGDASTIRSANGTGPAVFNVSRGLLYIDPSENFAATVRAEAERLAALLA